MCSEYVVGKGLSQLPYGNTTAYALLVATFGQNLRAIRTKRAKLTQVDLAKRLKLSGNSPVSGWENSDGVPEPDVIRDYAQALGVEPWELLEGVETELDRLRNRRDLPRHIDTLQSAHAESQSESALARVGTEAARQGAILPSRKAPASHVEARLREENRQLRAVLDTIAQALVALGTPESQASDAMAARKPRRGRRARKGA